VLIYGVGFMLVLLSCCGLALDLGTFEITRLRMQNAADAAAIGAIIGYQDGGYTTAAYLEAAQNGFTNGVNGVSITLSNPPTTGAYAGVLYAAQVTITKPVTGIFLRKTFNLYASATAVDVATPCVYLLSNSTTQPSLTAINETISTSCNFYAGLSYTFNGGSSSSGAQYYVAGSSANSTGTVSPTPVFGSPTLADPLGYVASPTVGTTCNYTNYSVTSSATLSPGVYCGGLTINTTAAVTFSAGFYAILGPLSINGPTLTGNGVTLYLSQGNGYSYGSTSIQNIVGTLKAPTTGTYQGILFFTDRTLPNDAAGFTLQNWNSNVRMDGIFYLSNQPLVISNITFKPAAYLGVVCDYLHINNTIFNPAATYTSLAGGNPFHPVGGASGIVE
jgi:hypothetical protein